jgi:hypothetical protein
MEIGRSKTLIRILHRVHRQTPLIIESHLANGAFLFLVWTRPEVKGKQGLPIPRYHNPPRPQLCIGTDGRKRGRLRSIFIAYSESCLDFGGFGVMDS